MILPTLHKRIRRSFLRPVLLFGALGVLLVVGITSAGRVPAYQHELRFHLLRAAVEAGDERRFLPRRYRENGVEGWEKRFDAVLEQASGNIIEASEQKAIDDLRAAWESYAAHPEDASYRLLHARIDELVRVNEGGMFERLARNARFRNLMMLATAAVFFCGTLWAFLMADSESRSA